MDIQQYIAADKELLLNLNGSQSLFWDGFMWVATSTIVWVPVAAMLLYIIIKNNKIQEALLTIVMIALVITLADQIASGLCKPFFARFRPTVRNFFGGHNFKNGKSVGIHLEPGPDGGLVMLDDTTVLEKALQILRETEEKVTQEA